MRQFLNANGFREEAVQARLGVAKLSESLGMRSNTPADDPLELLIQLFVLGESVPHLPQQILDLLTPFDLLQKDASRAWLASVALYPSGNVWIVSDKNSTSEHDDNEAEAPRVFSAITPQTEDFLDMLPQTACPAFLEMCAGAGAAALHAAATYATHAYAFDISPRCAHMAEWSRRLNGLENASVRQGDLYQPAGRRTFDRIAAHPPYVPSLRSEQLFRDGGEDGEFLTRRLIEGLPNYLHPGGAFYCLCLTAGIAGDPLHQRIRRWLREREAEFHLAIIVRRTVEPARLILDNWSHRYSESSDLVRWQSILAKRRIENFLYVTIVLRRHGSSNPPITVTRKAGSNWTIADAEGLLREQSSSDLIQAAPAVKAVRTQTRAANGWATPVCSYSSSSPFRVEHEGPEWIATVLPHAASPISRKELYRTAADIGVSHEEFETVIADLCAAGIFRLRPALHS